MSVSVHLDTLWPVGHNFLYIFYILFPTQYKAYNAVNFTKGCSRKHIYTPYRLIYYCFYRNLNLKGHQTSHFGLHTPTSHHVLHTYTHRSTRSHTYTLQTRTCRHTPITCHFSCIHEQVNNSILMLGQYTQNICKVL